MLDKKRSVDLLRVMAESAEDLPAVERELRFSLVVDDDATCVLVGSLLGLVRECAHYLSLYEELVSGAYENAPLADEEARLSAAVWNPLAQGARELAAKAGSGSQLAPVVASAWRAWSAYEKENFATLGRVRPSCK